ncbi:MAG: ArsB/NhaD family transporter [Geminicoccaceae bacterium]|nr:ArsB/NhaD family transporter [Geminicoccaceae bacterium]
MIAEASALSALGVTVLLVLCRPRIGGLIVGPAPAALAGVLLMAAAGHVTLDDAGEAATVLWRPLIAIASIMLIAAAAGHLGVINRLAATVLPLAGNSARSLFLLVFVLSALTAAVLNNDSAILVLTPLVVVLIRQIFPDRPALVVPYAFAVFMAAGVAPLVTSNPINLIVADFAGLDFNAYAVRMMPVALVSAVVTFFVLRRLFDADLRAAGAVRLDAVRSGPEPPTRWPPPERYGLLLVFGVLGAYPLAAYLGADVWPVALAGAIVASLLCARYGVISPGRLVAGGVAWQILVFLLGVFTLALGLRNAGAVDWLIALYTPPDLATIGVVSAVGSALINNHSMALTNIVAIDALPGAHTRELLAALIGGDLGPRLLPIGSLAGLLWYAILERMDVAVPLMQFVRIGVIVTAPSMAAALAALALAG